MLSNFVCGNEMMDHFIHHELMDYVGMGSCELYVVKAEDKIVAMFCLDQSNLSFSEKAMERMREGAKPIPRHVHGNDDMFWEQVSHHATEITYLAVSTPYQRRHIGSFIVENIVAKIAREAADEDIVIVRALNQGGYSAIPFYAKCGFFPAQREVANQNLFMYRVIV